MFGIGAGEMIVIAIVILIAVGPDRMPSLMKTIGKGMRDVRRTTNELRRSTGIDELLEDDDLRDPLGTKKLPKKPTAPPKPASHPQAPLAKPGEKPMPTDEDAALRAEQPPEGVDIAFAEQRYKDAIVAAKLAAAVEPSEPTT